MAKTENLDCVEVKRRAQRELLKEIRGGSLEEELRAMHRLAEESPLWKKLRRAKRKTRTRATKPPERERKIGWTPMNR
jgi:hypothetical protein